MADVARQNPPPHWASRAGKLSLGLAVGGCLIGAGSIWAMADYCNAGALHVALLVIGPLAIVLLFVGFLLAIASVAKSDRRWQPIVAIVLAIGGALPSLATVVPFVAIAMGGTLACNDETHPNYTPPGYHH
ncbi:MAG: hypothetical protein AAF721_13960 [Myxococcota bacterium]